MSLILDALRKSERARQQTLNGQISNVTQIAERSRLPTPWVTLIGLVLLLNAVVLAFLLWRTEQPAHPAAHIATIGNPVTHAPEPVIRPLADEVMQSGARDVGMPQTALAKSAPPAATSVAAVSVAASPDAAVAPLDSLPLAFQQSLPAMHLDVHSFASNPADRFVVINMLRYVAGDTLKEGPHVIAITQQGVILEYHGTRFLLPRN